MMMRYNRDAEDDSTKMALDSVLDFNMGDFVNRIRPGSLVMQLPDAEMASCPVYVAVSVLGMISLCIMLPKNRFQQLQALQSVMQCTIKVCPALARKCWLACLHFLGLQSRNRTWIFVIGLCHRARQSNTASPGTGRDESCMLAGIFHR